MKYIFGENLKYVCMRCGDSETSLWCQKDAYKLAEPNVRLLCDSCLVVEEKELDNILKFWVPAVLCSKTGGIWDYDVAPIHDFVSWCNLSVPKTKNTVELPKLLELT